MAMKHEPRLRIRFVGCKQMEETMSGKPVSKKQGWWAVTGAGLFLLMFTIILQVPRLHARADRRACLSRLRSFVAAINVAEAERADHRTAGTESPTFGTAGDGVTSQYFCPKTKNRFVYIGNERSSQGDDPGRVVAYEPWTEAHGEGGCVVYADAHAEFLPTARYHAVIGNVVE